MLVREDNKKNRIFTRNPGKEHVGWAKRSVPGIDVARIVGHAALCPTYFNARKTQPSNETSCSLDAAIRNQGYKILSKQYQERMIHVFKWL